MTSSYPPPPSTSGAAAPAPAPDAPLEPQQQQQQQQQQQESQPELQAPAQTQAQPPQPLQSPLQPQHQPEQQQQQPSSPLQQPPQIPQSIVHPQFDPEAHARAQATAIAAAAAAHHGLQALQAAVASPNPAPIPSPVTPQYGAHGDATAQYLPNNGTPVASSPPNSKVTRLRRACDMCSQRKVKCDEQHPCRPCRELNVDCTFRREMKRRGPPNRHAEAAKAAKRQRLEPNLSPGPHNAAETLISIAGTQEPQTVMDAELIAPWPVLVLLVDDFFTYIHPLTPFPHEPTFKQAFLAREDRTNREFLALLASMIGSLVASFPRTARLHLKAQHGMNLFPKAIHLIERCRTVAMDARGPKFLMKEEVTVYDAATSYFLGLAAGYVMQWKLCRRYMNETMTFIRELGYHKPRDLGSHMFGVTYRGPSFDHVQDQLGKRIFWVMFLGIRSMVQLGAPQGEVVLPPPTPSEPYPELPVEVDDEYILQHQILGQPQGIVSQLTGFNLAVKIYMTMNNLTSVELAYGIAYLPFHDQRAMLHECLQAVKQVMDGAPPELTLNLAPHLSNGDSGSGLGDISHVAPQVDLFDMDGLQYYPPAYPDNQPPSDIRHVIENQPERRRLLQYEIQKANIYASQLATRSYYVERYLNLRDAHREHTRTQAAHAYAAVNGLGPDGSGESSKSVAAAALQAAAEQADPIDANMSAERELIVQNLLTVLASINQRHMEPNGASFINKVRQVASTLVNDAPERKGPVAVRAQEPLSQFVDILMRLEKTTGSAVTNSGGDGTMTPQDEEQELRSWADLREHQMRFFQNGGFVSQI